LPHGQPPRKLNRMRRFLPAVGFLAALAIACGGSQFSAEEGEGGGGADGSVPQDAAGGPDGTVSTDASGKDASGSADVSTPEDSGGMADASGMDASGVDGGVHADAGDSGTTAKDAGIDAGECTGVGQCDSTHACPSTGGHVTCCPSIILSEKCGSCSAGVCPG
jgi:hypothetical protein